MHVQDQIVAGIQTPGHTGRLYERGSVRFPEEEVTIGVEAVAGGHSSLHTGDSLLPIHRVSMAQRGCAVDQHVSVMNHLRRPRLDLHRANIFRLGNRNRQDEIVKKIRAGGRDKQWRVCLQDKVGWPQLPIAGKDRCLGQIGQVPLRHSRLDPLLDRATSASGSRRLSANSPYPGSGSHGGI